MRPDSRRKLMDASVATLATALFKRGLRNQTLQDGHPVAHPQRLGVEQCPTVAVLVMDSRENARAESAGDILVTRLQMRAVAGVVTDSGFRDSMAIGKLDIPAYHQRPSSPTNLPLHQAIDPNVPIGYGDVAVFPGDIIVGDDDSVIVIPAGIADEIADEAVEMKQSR